jgi:hypothetical protein
MACREYAARVTSPTDPIAGPAPSRPGAAQSREPGAAELTTGANAAAEGANPWRRFDRWTSTFFIVLAVVTFLAALTVGPYALVDPTVPGAAVAAMIGVALVEIAVLGVASVGLDRRRPWGRTVALGLLLVIVGADVVRVVVDLTRGQVTIPLAAIVALYLLTARPGPLPALGGRDRRIAGGILAVAVLAQLAAIGPAVVA